MANIEVRTAQDGTTAYRVKMRLKGFPPQTATFHRRTDAKKWAQATEAAIREGRHVITAEAKKHTMTDMLAGRALTVNEAKPREPRRETSRPRW